MKCKICSADVQPVFLKIVLFKHSVTYFRCTQCGFLFTETPYWLEDAYREELKGIRDIGMVQRNLQVANITARFILAHFNPKGKFVDYGAGTGLLVRLMRDKGFDFYYDDPYARNIFARCFDASLDPDNTGGYELLTAFEVFEHSADPIEDVRKMLEYSDTILFSTELQPKEPGKLENWFYLLPDAGQHTSFYTPAALRLIAAHFSLELFSDNESFHILSKRRLSLPGGKLDLWSKPFTFRVANWGMRKVTVAFGGKSPLRSLIESDTAFVNSLLQESNGVIPPRRNAAGTGED